MALTDTNNTIDEIAAVGGPLLAQSSNQTLQRVGAALPGVAMFAKMFANLFSLFAHHFAPAPKMIAHVDNQPPAPHP